MHNHTCLDCGRIIETVQEGDCEYDSDHDFECCPECAAVARRDEEKHYDERHAPPWNESACMGSMD